MLTRKQKHSLALLVVLIGAANLFGSMALPTPIGVLSGVVMGLLWIMHDRIAPTRTGEEP